MVAPSPPRQNNISIQRGFVLRGLDNVGFYSATVSLTGLVIYGVRTKVRYGN